MSEIHKSVKLAIIGDAFKGNRGKSLWIKSDKTGDIFIPLHQITNRRNIRHVDKHRSGIEFCISEALYLSQENILSQWVVDVF